jgi:hypothetical protein
VTLLRVWQLVTRTHGPLTGSYNVCNAVIPSGKPTLAPCTSQPQSNFRCLTNHGNSFSRFPQISNRHHFKNNVKHVKMPCRSPVAEKILPGKRSHSGFSLASPDAVKLLPHWLMPTSPYGRLCSQASAIGETISLGLAPRNIVSSDRALFSLSK